MKLKYIMFDIFPVVFNPAISHRDFQHVQPQMVGPITSAGFVQITVQEPQGSHAQGGQPTVVATAYGRSDSLNLDSNPQDSLWLTKMFNFDY